MKISFSFFFFLSPVSEGMFFLGAAAPPGEDAMLMGSLACGLKVFAPMLSGMPVGAFTLYAL